MKILKISACDFETEEPRIELHPYPTDLQLEKIKLPEFGKWLDLESTYRNPEGTYKKIKYEIIDL